MDLSRDVWDWGQELWDLGSDTWKNRMQTASCSTFACAPCEQDCTSMCPSVEKLKLVCIYFARALYKFAFPCEQMWKLSCTGHKCWPTIRERRCGLSVHASLVSCMQAACKGQVNLLIM